MMKKTRLVLLLLCTAIVVAFVSRRHLTQDPIQSEKWKDIEVNLFTLSSQKSTTYKTTISRVPGKRHSREIESFLSLYFMEEQKTERRPFRFTITPWKIQPDNPRSLRMKDVSKDLKRSMVVLVKSKSTNYLQRTIARWTWAGFEFIRGLRIETIFIVGRATDEDVETKIQRENSTHGDILQLNMTEKYSDVIFKTLAGMEYASANFPRDWMYTSADDDIMPDLMLIRNKTEEMIAKSNNTVARTKSSNCTFKKQLPILCGFGYNVTPKPNRRNDSKWELSKEQYPLDLFPPYCNGGWYTMSLELASHLYGLSRKLALFWIDDIFVTGFLRLKHFSELATDCFLNETSVGIWTANSRYFAFSNTGNEDELKPKWAKYASKIFKNKFIHVNE